MLAHWSLMMEFINDSIAWIVIIIIVIDTIQQTESRNCSGIWVSNRFLFRVDWRLLFIFVVRSFVITSHANAHAMDMETGNFFFGILCKSVILEISESSRWNDELN